MRFDVIYSCTIEPHFCRSWDEEGGCYGTNPNHGVSFEEACNEVAEFYAELSKQWKNRTHHECEYYKDQGH